MKWKKYLRRIDMKNKYKEGRSIETFLRELLWLLPSLSIAQWGR